MCGRALLPRGGDWDIDHIVPVRDGGEHSIANVQTLCRRPCHLSKTNAERRARKARASKEQS
jgi:5-methylcytosine-specific restriction endonuclease McrA